MNLKSFSFAHKLIVCMICSLLASTTLFAVPAKREWRTVTQSDGTTINILTLGDEFYHYTINEDGQRVRLNKSGMYEVVGEQPTRDVIRSIRKNAMIRRQPQAVGIEPNLAPKGVVILANFNNSTMQTSHTQTVFDELCNSTSCTVNKYEGKDYPSAAQFFADQSNGSYRPQFDVFGPITLSHNVDYYGNDVWVEDEETGQWYQDEGNDTLAADAVMEACILADQKYTINWADYDSDNDGYVDFVYVIYAGQGQADGGASYTIWPHNWTLASARYYHNCTYTANQCKLGGKTIDNYACSGELSGDELCGIGTLCHEFGHVMGLPDLYDTDYGDIYEAFKTPNDWNIMDGGSYNGGGHCPPNYDPWQKYFFGWLTPENLGTEGKDVQIIANGEPGAKTYQINASGSLQGATTSGVCYYLENRQENGWDEFVPGHGLLIWKVNFNSTAWSNNEPNNSGTSGAPLWTVVSADPNGYIGLNGQCTERNSAGTCLHREYSTYNTFPGSAVVRTWDAVSGKALTSISEVGEVVSFKFNGGTQKAECNYELSSLGHCTVPTDGKVNTGAALSLTITPEDGYTLNDPSCWAVEMGLGIDLEFGKDFTYNAATNEFRIESVTDDVTIIVEAKQSFTITWKSKGTDFTTTESAGTVVLPEGTPAACGDGRTFVGWCKTADYEDETTAPDFVQNGDAATSGDIFYAVFANVTAAAAGFEKATSIAVGDEVVLVYEDGNTELSGIEGGSTKYGEGVAYTTTPAGAYLLEVVAGSTNGTYALKHGSDYLQWASGNSLNVKTSIDANSSWTITFSGGDATIKNAADNTRSLQWNSGNPRFACYTSAQKAVQLYKKAGGTTYANFTTSCAACDKLVNIIKGTAEHGSFAIDKTGEIEICAAAVVVTVSNITPSTGYQFSQITATPSEGITIDQNAKTVTIAKNTTGDLTINVEFVEKPKYTVNFYDRGEKVSEQEVTKGEEAVVPTLEPVCDGFTFVGWWTDELGTNNTEAKSWVSDFEINVGKNFYAIYSREVTESGVAFDGTNGGTFKIYAQVGDTKYYAKGSSIGKLDNTTNVAEATEYTFEQISGGFAIKAGTSYLSYGTSGTDFSTSSNAYKWTVASGVNGTWRVRASTGTNRAFVYRAGSTEKFGVYSTSNVTASGTEYYDLEIGGGSGSTTYYSSTVDCSLIPTAIENTRSEEPVAVKALRNGQIVIIRGEAVYSITGIRIQ